MTVKWSGPPHGLLAIELIQYIRTLIFMFIFNERAARRSRSTSRFGCHVSPCCLNNLNNSGTTSKCNYDGFR